MSIEMTRAGVRTGPPLHLIRQAKLRSLLAPVAPDLDRLEASGLVVRDGLLWVIFDNLPHVAAIHPALMPGPETATLVWQDRRAAGYEDIAQDDATGQRFILIEAARTAQGHYQPQIDEFDAAWNLLGRRWVDLDVEQRNKGLEGLTCVHRDGVRFLLALSEGNGHHGGRLGRRPGGGLIHVLAEAGAGWSVVDQIKLPQDLPFADYSGVSVRGDRIAVTSQESSALWVGRLDEHSWSVDGEGEVFSFPRDRKGRKLYGNVEGIGWIDDETVAAVSDRAKRSQPRRLRATAECVHIFRLPAAGEGIVNE
jgi:hypothetical protein